MLLALIGLILKTAGWTLLLLVLAVTFWAYAHYAFVDAFRWRR